MCRAMINIAATLLFQDACMLCILQAEQVADLMQTPAFFADAPARRAVTDLASRGGAPRDEQLLLHFAHSTRKSTNARTRGVRWRFCGYMTQIAGLSTWKPVSTVFSVPSRIAGVVT
jgi:hypothetical protein